MSNRTLRILLALAVALQGFALLLYWLRQM